MSPYTFEFEDGTVRSWELTPDGAEPTVEPYTPSIFVDGPDDALEALATRLASDPKVVGIARERWATDLHEAHVDETTALLKIDLERVGEVRTLAREIRGVHEREHHAPGTFRLYDVDLEPGFRYCLDRGIDPTPSRELRALELSLPEPHLSNGAVSELEIDGEPACADGGRDEDALQALETTLADCDPDVLVVSHADLVALLERRADDLGLDSCHLGRRPGWTQLASESTYESYGQVGHSPARYRVPGRAIVDTSNSFLWHQSTLEGIEYMVERTGRPLQEAAWGSIGTLLTARQVRMARREASVLAPWNKWEPERFSDVATLHAADRGGFTFAPEVGFHEDVHEIDFGSLYPRIICEYNVSPETVDCRCGETAGDEAIDDNSGAADSDPNPADDFAWVPELEYRICPETGFLPQVLDPLLADRKECKRRLREEDLTDEEAARLRAESGAIKWVLVSCFGYQGYRNAKFGRIECHEAINAYARELAVRTKRRLEDAGWRIVHGLVDSFWVTARAAEPEPLEAVIAELSDEIGIPLEHDGSYEWCSFVPLRDSIPTSDDRSSAAQAQMGLARTDGRHAAGALTKYFGKRTDGSYKYRGIACRRRSTCDFVADCQRELIEALDRDRDPVAVCDRLERQLAALRRGAVDPSTLVITTRASKALTDYDQRTRTVAALERYAYHGIDRHPGQAVAYVVADDDARGLDRVRLDFEAPSSYDADFYATRLLRACEDVLSPLGWDRTRIRRSLRDGRTVSLSTFVD